MGEEMTAHREGRGRWQGGRDVPQTAGRVSGLLYGQTGAALCLQALVHKEDSNHPK